MRINAKLSSVRGCQRASAPNPVGGMESGRREFLRWIAGFFAVGTVARISAGAMDSPPNRPSTSRSSREEAIQDIPINSLQEPHRSRIQQIVLKPTIYRRLPIEVMPCDADLYVFLVRYPEVVVNMWQLMGVTRVVIKRTSPYSYDAQDGAGTVSQVELVYGTRDKHLFLAEGYYEGPLLPRRVTGRCVLLLNSAYSKDQEQRTYISSRLDAFVQLDKVGAEIVAKTLHPLMGKTADTNFAETTRFVSQLSRVAENNGPGVQRLVTRLTNVEPTVRTRFLQIAATINQRSIMKEMVESANDPTERVSERPEAESKK